MVKAIPDGYHTVTPYLIVDNAVKALKFYKNVFGAKERMCMKSPGGKIMHAELVVGDSVIIIADEVVQMGLLSPKTIADSPVGFCLYVADVDKQVDSAVKAGAKLVRPIEDQFYGDRSGQIEDPFGHKWTIATHIEDVSPQEMERRAEDLYKP